MLTRRSKAPLAPPPQPLHLYGQGESPGISKPCRRQGTKWNKQKKIKYLQIKQTSISDHLTLKLGFLSSALPLQHPFSLPAKVLAMCKHEADFTCCKVQVPPGFEDGIALKMLFNALFNARGVKL